MIAAIEKTAARVRDEFESFVVLGIGGSALGPAAVHQALKHLHYNELPKEKRGGPRLYIEDNIDPERMAALLDVIDLKTTCFNIITKSGGTAETMSQYLIVLDHLKKAVGDGYRRHIIVTTSKEKASLSRLPSARAMRPSTSPMAWVAASPSFARWASLPLPSRVSTSVASSPAPAPWMSAVPATTPGRTPRCLKPA